MTEKEKHPYLEKYPLTKSYKYLVIGTMPPAEKFSIELGSKKKSNRTFKVEYFYGNVASFWKILKEIYNDYSFKSIENIQKWQEDYSIGITDTVKQCKRKKPDSTSDSDLILEWPADYNHNLKNYILTNKEIIEKLIFTSASGKDNSPLATFKKIMGDKYEEISGKIVDNLPSPSGVSNKSYFKGSDATLGLKKELYEYLIYINNPDNIAFVKKQWAAKKKAKKGEKITRIPVGMLKEFKIYKYKQIFPNVECEKYLNS